MFRITPVVKNILILNLVIWVLNYVFGQRINEYFALYNLSSEYFEPFQLFTYMWLHSGEDFSHILWNMIGILIFGPRLEELWGTKKFLIFYFAVGLGAGVLYGVADYVEKSPAISRAEAFVDNPSPDEFYKYVVKYLPKSANPDARRDVSELYENYADNPDSELLKADAQSWVVGISSIYTNSRMLGASGALYGILMAFGMIFPNLQLRLIIPPVTIRAKYIVFALGVMAVYSEINRVDLGVAHLAHLSGMVIAFIILKIWKQERNDYY
jgi:membrane associated rhomboid family serine protease